MLAIGNEELGAPVKKGDYVSNGKLRGVVEYSKDEDGVESDILAFVTTESGSAYLVGIKGQLLEGWEVIQSD